MNPRGRRIALAAAALGLLILAGVGFAVSGWVVEEWHIWQFKSATESKKELLADSLLGSGNRGKQIARDWYIQKLEASTWESGGWDIARIVMKFGTREEKLAEEWIYSHLKEEIHVTETEFFFDQALLGANPTVALPDPFSAMNDENVSTRLEAVGVLTLIGDGPAVDALRKALHDSDWRVRQAALTALQAIQRKRLTQTRIDPTVTTDSEEFQGHTDVPPQAATPKKEKP